MRVSMYSAQASARLIEIWCSISSGVKSVSVFPSSTDPMRAHEPASQAMAFTSVVLPDPPWPITARFRMFWLSYTFMDAPRDGVVKALGPAMPENVQNRHEERNAADGPFSTSETQKIDLHENVFDRRRNRLAAGMTVSNQAPPVHDRQERQGIHRQATRGLGRIGRQDRVALRR